MARIGQLAASKHAPQQYKPPRPPQTQVSVESMKASLSPRVDDLSNPRAKQLGPFRDPIWEVRMTSLVLRTSNIIVCPSALCRLSLMSIPKSCTKFFFSPNICDQLLSLGLHMPDGVGFAQPIVWNRVVMPHSKVQVASMRCYILLNHHDAHCA